MFHLECCLCHHLILIFDHVISLATLATLYLHKASVGRDELQILYFLFLILKRIGDSTLTTRYGPL